MNPNQIYSQNNALISQYGQQAAQQGQQYNTDQSSALQANQNLQNYQQNMQDLGQAYGQNVQSAEQQYGFNPADLKTAQQALASTQTTMANLPQAVQQSANGRMVTGAQMANRYAQTAGNVQNVLAGQGNAVNALQSTLQNSLNQAGQQTQFTGQSQQMNLGALQNLYQNYQQQQSQASALLQHYNTLQQNGVGLNVQEQQAQAAAASAAAQAQSAMAAMIAANSQAGLNTAEINALKGIPGSSTVANAGSPVATPSSNGGINFGSLLNQIPGALNSTKSLVNGLPGIGMAAKSVGF